MVQLPGRGKRGFGPPDGPQRHERSLSSGLPVPLGDGPQEIVPPKGGPRGFLQQRGGRPLHSACREASFVTMRLLRVPIWRVRRKPRPAFRAHRNSTPQIHIRRTPWTHPAALAACGVHTRKGKQGLARKLWREERPARRSSTRITRQSRQWPIRRKSTPLPTAIFGNRIVQSSTSWVSGNRTAKARMNERIQKADWKPSLNHRRMHRSNFWAAISDTCLKERVQVVASGARQCTSRRTLHPPSSVENFDEIPRIEADSVEDGK